MRIANLRKFSWIAPLGLTAGLAACSSWFDGPAVQVRAVETKSDPANDKSDGLYASAVSAINVRDYGRALDYLQAAKARDPGDIKVLNALGVVYDKLGRFDLSTRYYAQARAIDPNSGVVSRNIAYSDVLQGLMSGERLASATPSSTQAVAALEPVVVPANGPAAVPAQPRSGPVQASVADVAASQSVTSVTPVPSPALSPSPATQQTLLSVQAWNNVTNTSKEKPTEPETPQYSFLTSAAADHLPAVPLIPIRVERKQVVTIGHPFKVLDATGRTDVVGAVSGRLTQLGWTIRQSPAPHPQKLTVLFYPPQNAGAASAMQRTLPFPVHLTLDAAGTMRLVVGTEFLSWKPTNPHLAALWKKKAVIAALPRTSATGVR